MKTITLSLSDLRNCLFKHDQFFGEPPQTTVTGDTATVKILPKSLGQLIAEVDLEEDFFHIELLDDRAELWTIFDWKESNAKRLRLRQHLDAERLRLNKEIAEREKELALLTEIADELEIARLPKPYCQMWAKILYQNREKDISPFLSALEQLNVDIRPILNKVSGL